MNEIEISFYLTSDRDFSIWFRYFRMGAADKDCFKDHYKHSIFIESGNYVKNKMFLIYPLCATYCASLLLFRSYILKQQKIKDQGEEGRVYLAFLDFYTAQEKLI